MAYTGKAINKMERMVPEKAAKAIKIAYKRALNEVGEVVIASNGAIFRVTKDGKQTLIKKIAKKTPVKKGSKLKIV